MTKDDLATGNWRSKYCATLVHLSAVYLQLSDALRAPFVPITIGAPQDGYPPGHFKAGGEPYGMTYNAADPEDAERIAASVVNK